MKIDTPKCHTSTMEIMAYSKNFQLAYYKAMRGKAAIYLPGPSKDKGFSGLGLDIQYTWARQTFAF